MQLVGYEPSGRGPALVVGDGGTIERRPLEAGDRLAYVLGTRRCAGTVDDGEHVACDRPSAPHCDYHASTWVCARCTGTCLKDEMDCYEEHAVYLAAFAPDTFKVGVTRSWRLETRLREQGADRAAHVHTVSNGRIAREIEAEIAERLVDRVRTDAKVDSLAATVDDDAWEALLSEFDVIDRFSFDYGLDLERRPVRETVATGTVLGVRGRLLVLENAGTAYAVDMRDLVGYELEAGETSRDLQSSLGSFG
ncbi:DUF2797 domain-containing protein [Natrarchaeobius oligotrophus]|uniref:DUF2797 domain-containing protein n=1 Tax=Natrarchaeobius chitinivorans TaxID=1679083 RepID=A0A3N6MXL2_NATCH|nr:DUF2797 domain-containing protein [Natrarchaeobius chitinivorans]RQG99756.1 DUF2797 domain-containing protein [Natrarchaeobius chitinivorans]